MTEYVGTDNLEVMVKAINYNTFLIDLVVASAKPGDLILDFGAGIGTFAERLKKLGLNVCCLEPDPKQAALVRLAGLTTFNNLSEIADGTIDYVYTLNVLEHIEDEHAALTELYRKLRPGGRLLAYVPAFQVLYSRMDKKVGHYRRYTKDSLARVVRNAKFSIVSTGYCDSAGFIATILYKLFGDRTGGVDVRALLTYDRLIFPLSRRADVFLGSYIGKNCFLVGLK